MYKDTKLARGRAVRRRDNPPTAPTITFGRLRVGSTNLHYRVAGAGAPLILIHGYSASGCWWRANMPALAANHRVYALDLAGFGRSHTHDSFTLNSAVNTIVAWMDALGIQKANICGHSMGGHIAMKLAQAYPERVAKLVLADASGLPLHAPVSRLAWRGLRGAGHTHFRFTATVVGTSLQAGPRSLYRAARAVLSDSVEDALGAIVAPTLIVWGERDVLIPLEIGYALHRGIARSRLVVLAGGGHNIMLEQPRQFNQLVHEFLAA